MALWCKAQLTTGSTVPLLLCHISKAPVGTCCALSHIENAEEKMFAPLARQVLSAGSVSTLRQHKYATSSHRVTTIRGGAGCKMQSSPERHTGTQVHQREDRPSGQVAASEACQQVAVPRSGWP